MTASNMESVHERVPILLVDDHAANLLALEAVLDAPEHELVSARSGQEALAQLAMREFAVVLLDLQMPVMDGVETALGIRRLSEDRGRIVPIIFLTATDATVPRVLHAYASGAVDMIQKPLQPDILRSKVQVFGALFRTQRRLLVEIERRKRLRDALDARDRRLAIVSHDLRNPLNAIVLGATQARRAVQEHHWVVTDKSVMAIARAAERMSRLVKDLLDLATLDAGRPLSIEPRRHDLRELAVEIIEELEPLALSAGLTLRADFVHGLCVVCDRERVQQVLANLIGNAIKFSPSPGSIDVVARRENHDVVVSVRDTGVGIRSDQVAHVFDSFWKGDPNRKSGVGLGLSIAREIVEAHGGRIWVDTAEGKGSTFSFTLTSAHPAVEASL